MQQTLENFLRALRAMDVRVSPAEAIDAHCTVDSVGYSDRTLLKDSLCIALAKSEEEVERVDECFDIFFTRDEFRDREEEDESEGLSDAENEMLGEQPLAAMLLGGSETEMAQAMEQAANEAGVANIRFSTQRGLFTRRILDRMGLRDLERLIASLNRQEGDEAAADMAGRLEQGRGYLFEEGRQYIDRQFDLYARNAGEELRQEFLAKTNLSSIERRDFDRMHRIVRRMAKKLATRYARRRKHTKRGVLDVRRTLRKSMPHGGIPFETVWKQTKIERPRIVVIVDVSQSVAAAARFLLLFLYSLHEVISTLRAFAFSSHLIEVSDILKERDVEEAIPEILEKIGFRYLNQVDPFDGGPYYGAARDAIASVRDRRALVLPSDVALRNSANVSGSARAAASDRHSTARIDPYDVI